jgi:hypothetical protein
LTTATQILSQHPHIHSAWQAAIALEWQSWIWIMVVAVGIVAVLRWR